jgi:copine 5/8/9
LANGDWRRPLKIEAWDYTLSGKKILIGEAKELSLSKLEKLSESKECIDLKKKDGAVCGILVCDKFSSVEKPTFFEYIKGGTEINFMVGIDFTSSNDPDVSSPNSLHYDGESNRRKSQSPLNPYSRAIQSIGRGGWI